MLSQFVGRVDFEIEPGQKIEKGLTHERAVGLSLGKLADRHARCLQRRYGSVHLVRVGEDFNDVVLLV